MYACENCGCVFDEDEVATMREESECWGSPAYEEFYVCPRCKSGDYHTAEECPVCGEYKVFFGNACDDCKNGIMQRLRDFVNKEFTQSEIDAINEILSEEEL